MPSMTWKAAATCRKLTASASTSALAGMSGSHSDAIWRGHSSSTSAVPHMKVLPMAIAVKPARRAAFISPAPDAIPTRIVDASPMPRGIIKVSEGMVMAI